MRSIKARFERSKQVISRKHAGSYIHLSYAVIGQNFSRKVITKAFNSLIPKDEFGISERKGLVDYLVSISQITPLRRSKKHVKLTFKATKSKKLRKV